MSAEEALKYGLIDEIVQPDDAKLKALSLPPPGQAPQLFGELPADAEGYQFGKLVSLLMYTCSIYSVQYCVVFSTICTVANNCI